MPESKRKRQLSGKSPEEPRAKRPKPLGTPNFSSTPHPSKTASKTTDTPKNRTTPKNGHTPDSGLLGGSAASKFSGGSAKNNGSSPVLKVKPSPIRTSSNSTPLLKSVLKTKSTPNSGAKSTPSSGFLSRSSLNVSTTPKGLNLSVNKSVRLNVSGNNSMKTPNRLTKAELKKLNSSSSLDLSSARFLGKSTKKSEKEEQVPTKRTIEDYVEDFSSQPVSAASLRGLISGIVLSTGKGLIVALDKLKENLEYLDISHADLMDEMTKLPWAHHPSEISKAFNKFFIALLLHHPFYNKDVFKSMLKQLTVITNKDDMNRTEFKAETTMIVSTIKNVDNEVINVQKNVNSFVKVLLRTMPNEKKEVLRQIGFNFPYYKGTAETAPKFVNYLRGTLGLYDYLSDAGEDILQIAFESVIGLDASIPKNHLHQYYKQLQRKDSIEKKGKPQQENGKADSKLTDNDNNTRSSEDTSAGEENVDDSSDSDSDTDSDSSSDEEGDTDTPAGSPAINKVDLVQCKKMDDCMAALFAFVNEKCFDVEEHSSKENDVSKKSSKSKDKAEANKDKSAVKIVFSSEKAQTVVQILFKLFASHILLSCQLHNTQYLIFYLVNQNRTYVKQFLKLNWEIFTTPNQASIIRQAAISHFSGFICRSQLVDAKILKKWLKTLFNWLLKYADLDSSSSCDFMSANLKVHGPFYSACQSAFHIVAFRHTDLVEHDDVSFLRGLDVNRLIIHPLNPLRVINKSVLQVFSKTLAFYQVAYCDNIIQRNARITLPVIGLHSQGNAEMQAKPLLLDDHFPYDPIMLPKIKHLIDPLFKKYEGLKDYVSETDGEGQDEFKDGDKKSYGGHESRNGGRERKLSNCSSTNLSVHSFTTTPQRTRKLSFTEIISKEINRNDG